jgi:hypothetical protein
MLFGTWPSPPRLLPVAISVLDKEPQSFPDKERKKEMQLKCSQQVSP